MTAPGVNQHLHRRQEKGVEQHEQPRQETMVSTRNIALVTGLRLNGLATTRKPQSSVSDAKR